MIRINLLPEAQQTTRRFEAVSTAAKGGENLATIALIVFLVIGLGVAAFQYWRLTQKKKDLQGRISVAEAEIERLKPIMEEVERFKKKKALLEKKLNLIQDLKANQKGPVHIMDELSNTLPEYLWLADMKLKGTNITLRGGAMNPNEVAEFLKNIDDSPYFKEPSLKEIRERKDYYSFNCNFGFTFNPKKTPENKEVKHGS